MTRRLGTFDSETTGVNPLEDRIVTAYLGIVEADGTVSEEWSWTIDPGIPIPEGATKVHGITTDHVRAHGDDPQYALGDIGEKLQAVLETMPVVIYNAPYDLTILDADIRRNEAGLIGDFDGVSGLWFPAEPIIDPLVLDKAMDKWRKGSRKLQDVAQHYSPGKFADYEWHGARADALAAAYIAQLMLTDYRLIAATSEELHRWQIAWYRKQAESFRDYRIRRGEDVDGIGYRWPMAGIEA